MSDSLAALFDKVKAQSKDKKQVKGQKSVRLGYRWTKGASPTLLTDKVANEGDEWALNVNEITAQVIEAIEWRPMHRVLLAQHWVCSCGNHGTNILGRFIKEESAKTRSQRMRNVGLKYDPDALQFAIRTEWLDAELTEFCPKCTDEVDGAACYQPPLELIHTQLPPAGLVELAETLVEQMQVAKPGFDIEGKRMFAEEQCLTDSGNQDKAEQKREAERFAIQRWAI